MLGFRVVIFKLLDENVWLVSVRLVFVFFCFGIVVFFVIRFCFVSVNRTKFFRSLCLRGRGSGVVFWTVVSSSTGRSWCWSGFSSSLTVLCIVVLFRIYWVLSIRIFGLSCSVRCVRSWGGLLGRGLIGVIFRRREYLGFFFFNLF